MIIHGTIKTSPHNNAFFPRIEGNIKLKSKLLITDIINDEMAIHKKDSGGFPVKTSQKPINRAIINP